MAINIVNSNYKKTEIGTIPIDWELISFDKAFEFLSTASYSRDELIEGKEIGYIHYGDIHTKWNRFLNLKYDILPTIDIKKIKSHNLVKDGDLILADASEDYAGICKSIEVENIDDKKVISGLHTFLLRDRKDIFVNGFKGYIILNKIVKNQIDRLATGLKVYGVSKNNLKKILIPKPSEKEQKLIVQVLRDADKLIVFIDKLIQKKKNIKQGAMQELLTGKKRLPGFNTNWGRNKLEDIAEITKGRGLSKNKLSKNGKHPCILYGELFTTYNEEIKNIFNSTNYNEGILSKFGDVLIPGSTTTTGIDLAKASALLVENVQIGGDINIIRNYKKIYDPVFLSYSLTHIYRRNIAQKTKGITIYHLHGTDLQDLEIIMPNIEEQSAIAQILSKMDSEIEQLERKRDKYQSIKQGMMQELLTGRIRLK